MKNYNHVIAVLLFIAFICACGQKGPLRMPEKTPPEKIETQNLSQELKSRFE